MISNVKQLESKQHLQASEDASKSRVWPRAINKAVKTRSVSRWSSAKQSARAVQHDLSWHTHSCWRTAVRLPALWSTQPDSLARGAPVPYQAAPGARRSHTAVPKAQEVKQKNKFSVWSAQGQMNVCTGEAGMDMRISKKAASPHCSSGNQLTQRHVS